MKYVAYYDKPPNLPNPDDPSSNPFSVCVSFSPRNTSPGDLCVGPITGPGGGVNFLMREVPLYVTVKSMGGSLALRTPRALTNWAIPDHRTAIERWGNISNDCRNLRTENGSRRGYNLALTILFVPTSLGSVGPSRCRDSSVPCGTGCFDLGAGEPLSLDSASQEPKRRKREFFIDNLLVRIHFTIVVIRWTGLASWEPELTFPGSLTSTFLVPKRRARRPMLTARLGLGLKVKV